MEVRTLILGAGAAGLFCAAHAGADVLVVDHAKAPGEKIRISGGGRCNFTNLGTTPAQFLSRNPHFARSALARYTPQDFLALVEAHGIAWHEKTLGQLFCDHSSREVVSMLTGMVAAAGARLWLQTHVGEIGQEGDRFRVLLTREGREVVVRARHLVVATGGKSIPKMGATGLGYEIAARFGLAVTETAPALVPFTFGDAPFAALAGVAVPVRLSTARAAFEEAILFTHRGLSGPAVLQLSSYWREGEEIVVDLDPGGGLKPALRVARGTDGRKAVGTVLARHLPARLGEHLGGRIPAGRMAEQGDRALDRLVGALRQWRLRPGGTEGYRTAEVTLGGVATGALSSTTMEAREVPGLFFIGECVDVTGWLGGYNFQWAWASAHAAGTAIAARG
ncbi:MAG: NAD(P)/FAD-dependent oxidoreductase [Rubellimicrobium sp.]|nr:NAD(P)/FAD-dependent oxidoreductase [Rubellimicrobium sp.]